MTAAAVLEAFAAVGVQLREDAGQVVYRAPFGKVTPALRDALRDHEVEVLGLLHSTVQATVNTSGQNGQNAAPLAGSSQQPNAPPAVNLYAENGGELKLHGDPLTCTPKTQAADNSPTPTHAREAAAPKIAQTCGPAQTLEAAPPAIPRHKTGTCYCCGGTEFWASPYRERICCRCYPQLATLESREAYEERAGILEHDAKLPRPEAERLAKEMTHA